MQTRATAPQDKQNSATPRVTKESSNGGTATFVDNRPSTVTQRKLQEAMTVQRTTTKPPQDRRAPQGSARFQQIATAMGHRYGVDTSGLVATHNSSFPATLNAEATIQGNKIHFAPGRDTDYNMKHEVSHAIDNALHGTPPGGIAVSGKRVDTTREKVVDRMAKDTIVQNRKRRAENYTASAKQGAMLGGAPRFHIQTMPVRQDFPEAEKRLLEPSTTEAGLTTASEAPLNYAYNHADNRYSIDKVAADTVTLPKAPLVVYQRTTSAYSGNRTSTDAELTTKSDRPKKKPRGPESRSFTLLSFNMQGMGTATEAAGDVVPNEMLAIGFLPLFNQEFGGSAIYFLQEAGNWLSGSPHSAYPDRAIPHRQDLDGVVFTRWDLLGYDVADEPRRRTDGVPDTPRYMIRQWYRFTMEIGRDNPLVLHGYYFLWDPADVGSGRVNLAIASTEHPDGWGLDTGNHEALFYNIIPNPAVTPTWTERAVVANRTSSRSGEDIGGAIRDVVFTSDFFTRPLLGMRVRGTWFYTIHSTAAATMAALASIINAVERPAVIAGDFNYLDEGFIRNPGWRVTAEGRSYYVHGPNTETYHARQLFGPPPRFPVEVTTEIPTGERYDYMISVPATPQSPVAVAHGWESRVISYALDPNHADTVPAAERSTRPVDAEGDAISTLTRLTDDIRYYSPGSLSPENISEELRSRIPSDHNAVRNYIRSLREDAANAGTPPTTRVRRRVDPQQQLIDWAQIARQG